MYREGVAVGEIKYRGSRWIEHKEISTERSFRSSDASPSRPDPSWHQIPISVGEQVHLQQVPHSTRSLQVELICKVCGLEVVDRLRHHQLSSTHEKRAAAVPFILLSGWLFDHNAVQIPESEEEYFTRTSVWEQTAAADLGTGRLEQSPRDHTFGYLVCWRVALSILTQPDSLESPAYLMKELGLEGGETWRKSNLVAEMEPSERFLKTAYIFSLSTSTSSDLKWTLMSQASAILDNSSEQTLIGNIDSLAVKQFLPTTIPLSIHSLVSRYMIFCEAPSPFTTDAGSVKMAFPPLNFLPNNLVLCEYLYEQIDPTGHSLSSRASFTPLVPYQSHSTPEQITNWSQEYSPSSVVMRLRQGFTALTGACVHLTSLLQILQFSAMTCLLVILSAAIRVNPGWQQCTLEGSKILMPRGLWKRESWAERLTPAVPPPMIQILEWVME